MTETDNKTKEKIKLFELWMQGDHVLIYLNSGQEGVVVPEYLKDNKALTLKVSYLFQGETTHNDQEISTYLKFSGNYFQCIIPWKAVWGLRNSEGESQVWPDQLPLEVLKDLIVQQIEGSREEQKQATTKPQPNLHVEEGGKGAGSKSNKPVLKRIK